MASATPIGRWWNCNARHGGRGSAWWRWQPELFEENSEPEWAEVDLKGVRVERSRTFGGPWLGLELCRLVEFFEQAIVSGREEIPWPAMALVLVLGRMCEPSSELRLAEHFYESSALADLLGAPAAKVNEDHLYRALDRLLPHKEELEKHLKDRLGELFNLDYDLLLYDVTSTYFEGEAATNPLAQRGYSRDHRPNCKQVNIAPVVSRCGMPLGYRIFAGNRADVTTPQEIVGSMEARYGKAQRIWVMDRGMVSAENIEYLKQEGRRYIVGTPKAMLKRFECELLAEEWKQVQKDWRCASVPRRRGKKYSFCAAVRSAARKSGPCTIDSRSASKKA